MEWTVEELAERAGISGRTMRHYHQIGPLEPKRLESNGYRCYGANAVSRPSESYCCVKKVCH